MTGCLERELQMVQLSATRYSCVAVLWVSLVSFAAMALCIASERVLFISLSTQPGNFLIHLRTWSRVLLEKLIVTQLVKFPAFYRTWRFVTVLTRSCHWSLSWARWIQSTSSHCISLRSVILSSYPCLGLSSGLFSSSFPTRILYAFLISHMLLFSSSVSSSLIWSPNNIWRSVQVTKFLIMQSSPASFHFLPHRFKYFSHYPVLKHPQSMLFPYCVTDQVSHLYNKTRKIIVLPILEHWLWNFFHTYALDTCKYIE
jgi:hypothetical protein